MPLPLTADDDDDNDDEKEEDVVGMGLVASFGNISLRDIAAFFYIASLDDM